MTIASIFPCHRRSVRQLKLIWLHQNSGIFLAAEIDRGLSCPAPRLPECALECSISQSRQAPFDIAVLKLCLLRKSP